MTCLYYRKIDFFFPKKTVQQVLSVLVAYENKRQRGAVKNKGFQNH